MKRTAMNLCAAFVVAAIGTSALADVYNMGPEFQSLEVVFVGNPGNANDDTGYGGVPHNYHIGKYEVTNAQYAEFLNNVAGSDPYRLFNGDMTTGVAYTLGGITRSGSPGSYTYAAIADRGDKPVNYVSFWDACRFANWLNNGQGAGDTETGAYTLNNVVNPLNTSVSRNLGAQVFIPTEDEWYKAAYYDPATASHWDYATATNALPTVEAPPGTDAVDGSANYVLAVDVTDVGAYAFKPSASEYGTYDQDGNVWEWNEAIVVGPTGSERQRRGGARDSIPLYVGSGYRSSWPAGGYNLSLGFRVATTPEPATMTLLALGAVGMLTRRRRVRG